MIGKVVAGADLMRAAGTVTKRLTASLGERGYVGTEEAGVRCRARRDRGEGPARAPKSPRRN